MLAGHTAASMPQFELKDVATVTARLDEVSLDAETVWRPLDDTRVKEIEQNIMDGNWMASPIEFPSLIGNAAGKCFEAKACQLFNFGWCMPMVCWIVDDFAEYAACEVVLHLGPFHITTFLISLTHSSAGHLCFFHCPRWNRGMS